MVTRRAECSCGQLSAVCSASPCASRYAIAWPASVDRGARSATTCGLPRATYRSGTSGRVHADWRRGRARQLQLLPGLRDHRPLPDRYSARSGRYPGGRLRRPFVPAALPVILPREPALRMGRGPRRTLEDVRLKAPAASGEDRRFRLTPASARNWRRTAAPAGFAQQAACPATRSRSLRFRRRFPSGHSPSPPTPASDARSRPT